jgi:hypothetical protein
MKASYFVMKETVCAECSGKGMIEHPLWKKFSETFGDKASELSNAEIERWFSNQGWTFAMLPYEEELCPECEGNKIIVERVELTQALTELGFELTKATP